MKTKTTNVKITARDILKLPFTYYCDDEGLMSFSIDMVEDIDLSEIFLRNILENFGDYKIIGQNEYFTEFSDIEDGEYDIGFFRVFHTNLPKDLFIEVVGDNVFIQDIHDIDEFFIEENIN